MIYIHGGGSIRQRAQTHGRQKAFPSQRERVTRVTRVSAAGDLCSHSRVSRVIYLFFALCLVRRLTQLCALQYWADTASYRSAGDDSVQASRFVLCGFIIHLLEIIFQNSSSSKTSGRRNYAEGFLFFSLEVSKVGTFAAVL